MPPPYYKIKPYRGEDLDLSQVVFDSHDYWEGYEGWQVLDGIKDRMELAGTEGTADPIVLCTRPLSNVSLIAICRQVVVSAKKHQVTGLTLYVADQESVDEVVYEMPSSDLVTGMVMLGTMKVEWSIGSILDYPAEVMVNSCAPALRDTGGVSEAIHMGAGSELSNQLEGLRQQLDIRHGDVFATDPFQIKGCKMILHAVASDATEKSVRNCLRSIFKMTRDAGYAQLTLPVLGAGQGRLPLVDSTRYIAEELKDFQQSNGLQPFQVRLVCWTERAYWMYVQAFAQIQEASPG